MNVISKEDMGIMRGRGHCCEECEDKSKETKIIEVGGFTMELCEDCRDKLRDMLGRM